MLPMLDVSPPLTRLIRHHSIFFRHSVADLRLRLSDQHTRFNSVCEHQAIVAPALRLRPRTAAILLLGAPGGFQVAAM